MQATIKCITARNLSATTRQESLRLHLTVSFEVKVIPGTKEYQDKKTYKLSPGFRRGKAMIINFETFEGTDYDPREGSQKDVVNLRALFSQLGKYNNHCVANIAHQIVYISLVLKA